MIWILLQLFILISDQCIKLFILNLKLTAPIQVIPNVFYITSLINRGAAWGMFQNGRYVLIAFTAIALIALNYTIFKYNIRFLNIALSLVAGGALGNFVDRVVRGGVVDFLDFYIGSYHYPVFNIADSCIVAGTVMLMWYIIFFSNAKEKTNEKSKFGGK